MKIYELTYMNFTELTFLLLFYNLLVYICLTISYALKNAFKP